MRYLSALIEQDIFISIKKEMEKYKKQFNCHHDFSHVQSSGLPYFIRETAICSKCNLHKIIKMERINHYKDRK